MIRTIHFSETYPIRHQVMWPNEPIAFVYLEDDAEGQHYGYFFNEQLVSVISLFKINNKVQFRKFATLNEFQGQGYGTALLSHVIKIYSTPEVTSIWCNARLEKSEFYERFGLKKTEKNFEKKGQQYVIMALTK